MMAKMYGPLAEYITAFGVIDSASNTVDRVFTHGEKGRGKWGYGYCVCEICHTVVETLQLKMFQDYGIGFQEQDVYVCAPCSIHYLLSELLRTCYHL